MRGSKCGGSRGEGVGVAGQRGERKQRWGDF